jgi:hypothetical protein
MGVKKISAQELEKFYMFVDDLCEDIFTYNCDAKSEFFGKVKSKI